MTRPLNTPFYVTPHEVNEDCPDLGWYYEYLIHAHAPGGARTVTLRCVSGPYPTPEEAQRDNDQRSPK